MDDLTRLARDFQQASRLAPRQLGTALGKGADDIRDKARANVRQNISPRFARGIISRRERSGPPAAYVLTTGKNASVIHAWEVGTARHGPKPSIAPAVEQAVGSIADHLASLVDPL